MHLRPALQSDIPSIGSIQAECNLKDTLARFFIKNANLYPTTYLRSSIRFIKQQTASPGTFTHVIETDVSDYSHEDRHRAPEVVAFMVSLRIGQSEKAKEWQGEKSGFWAGLNRVLLGWEDRYLKVFRRVECTKDHEAYASLLPVLNVPFDPKIFAEAWVLKLLFVSPAWQRRGLGRMLMGWIFEQAQGEGVPVLVKSSPMGAKAYRSAGFRSLGEIGLDKLFDTREFGGEVPQMWVWEPKGLEGRWFGEGKRKLDEWKKENGRGDGERTGMGVGVGVDDVALPL